MIKINLICVGNLKDKFFIDGAREYEKRLSRFCNLKIIELKEHTHLQNTQQIKIAEGEEILKNLSGYIILMDVKGKSISSEELAKKIDNLSLCNSEISFIVGGSYGVSEEVKARANEKLSVSAMTFPHRLFRVMLLEQIYRAFAINSGSEYHK